MIPEEGSLYKCYLFSGILAQCMAGTYFPKLANFLAHFTPFYIISTQLSSILHPIA